ncbi:hypothetical protein [Haloarcula halophila]|uniref:hypothetical protein n=1 Tax=Haloarcula TaxID=2237 RepID=UPI0023E47602|nr:hypothetical protein [Halomicroarcula sp. DFY41]
MPDDKPVYFYTSEETKQRINDQADEAGLSVSDFCEQVLKEHLEDTTSQSQEERYHPSQRLEVTIDDARRDLEAAIERLETAVDEEITDIQSLRTVYAISIWELLKSEYGSPHRKEAMQTAAARVKKAENDSSRSDKGSSHTDETTAPSEPDQATGSDQPANSSEL